MICRSNLVSPAYRRLNALLTLALAATLLGACVRRPPKVKPPEDGKTTGLILVGSPKVFARERLVRDREEQKKWLKGQLEIADAAFDAFQGAVQTRQLSRRSTSFGVDATAATGLAIRQSEAGADDLRRAQEVADLEHQVRIAELERQLQAVEAGEPANTTAAMGTGSGTESGESESSGGASESSGSSMSSGTGDSSGAATSGSASPTLPGTAIDPISVKDRPLDRFRDRLAYREEVRQELLDNDLDDAHDLAGSALYRLAFDTTVFPAKDSSRWALVQMEIDPEDPLGCPSEEADWSKVEADRLSQLLDLSEGFVEELLLTLSHEADTLARAYVAENLAAFPRETAALVYRPGSDAGRQFLQDAKKLDAIEARVGAEDFVKREKEIEEQRQRLSGPLDTLRSEVKTAEKELKNANQAQKQASELQTKLRQESADIGFRISEKKQEIEARRDEREEQEEANAALLAEADLDAVAHERQRRALSEEIARLEDEIGEMEATLAELEISDSAVRSKLRDTDIELIEAEKEIASARRTLGEERPKLATAQEELDALQTRTELDRRVKDRAARVLAKVYREILEARYRLETPDFKKVLYLQKIDNRPEVNVHLVGDTPADRTRSFCRLINGWTGRTGTYAVPPRASVERISDSAGFRSEQESAVSAALTAGTVNVGAAISYLDALESQRQGIRRQPLVVGYSRPARCKVEVASASKKADDDSWAPCDDNTRADKEPTPPVIGWILGPRFQPRYDSAGFDYRHRATQIPLSAVVTVPAWWTSVKLRVRSCWAMESFDPKTSSMPPCKSPDKYTFNVRLPGDASSILRELIPRARRPQPFFYQPGPDLEIGRKERVVVYGRDLWRNPQIFLGSQPADDVEILPDMEGLVATFNKIEQPAGWTKNQPNGPVDVWVWTSEGNDSAGQARIHKPHEKPKADEAKLNVEVESSSPFIAADKDRRGVAGLSFKFAQKEVKKEKVNLVKRVFLAFEGSVPDLAGVLEHQEPADGAANPPPPPCLVMNDGVLQVNRTCRPSIKLANLVLNTNVTITVYRTSDDTPNGKRTAKESIVLMVR